MSEPKPKKLTLPQIKELVLLATGIQETHGHTRARVQNSLREKRFVRLFNADGHEPSTTEILLICSFRPVYDRCEITDAGRAALEQDPGARRYLKQAAEQAAWLAEYEAQVAQRQKLGTILPNGTKVFVDDWDGVLGEVVRYSESILGGSYFIQLEFQRTDWFEADRVFVATPEQIAEHTKALEGP